MKAFKILKLSAWAMILGSVFGLLQLACGSRPSVALLCANHVLYALVGVLILYVARWSRIL